MGRERTLPRFSPSHHTPRASRKGYKESTRYESAFTPEPPVTAHVEALSKVSLSTSSFLNCAGKGSFKPDPNVCYSVEKARKNLKSQSNVTPTEKSEQTSFLPRGFRKNLPTEMKPIFLLVSTQIICSTRQNPPKGEWVKTSCSQYI